MASNNGHKNINFRISFLERSLLPSPQPYAELDDSLLDGLSADDMAMLLRAGEIWGSAEKEYPGLDWRSILKNLDDGELEVLERAADILSGLSRRSASLGRAKNARHSLDAAERGA
jgi:hypothetical protein